MVSFIELSTRQNIINTIYIEYLPTIYLQSLVVQKYYLNSANKQFKNFKHILGAFDYFCFLTFTSDL